jgi:hypothetical protein
MVLLGVLITTTDWLSRGAQREVVRTA